MKIGNLYIKASLALPYLYDKILSVFYKNSMKYCGMDVYTRPSSSDYKGLANLSVCVGGAAVCLKVQ